LIDELAPFFKILGRISPARENAAVVVAGLPVVLVRFGPDRERFRHEADLNIRPHAMILIRVEDLVENLPVIYWITLFIFAVGIG
jgi:hypothetical protein